MPRGLVGLVRGALAGLLLLVGVPSSALAQTTAGPSGELQAAQAEVDRDYAEALSADCALACRALDAMKRATDRLCSLDPGDPCATARKKLDDATSRVRTSCPDCASALGPRPTMPLPPTAPASAGVVANESVQRTGGCAGCAMTRSPADATLPLALAGLLGLAVRRRKGRARR